MPDKQVAGRLEHMFQIVQVAHWDGDSESPDKAYDDFRLADERARWLSKRESGTTTVILAATPTGRKPIRSYPYERTPYKGPLVKVKVGNIHRPGYVHRTPIDCGIPRPNYPLYLGSEWRIIENSLGKSSEECRMKANPPRERENPWGLIGDMACQCGVWWIIEGSPDAVREAIDDRDLFVIDWLAK